MLVIPSVGSGTYSPGPNHMVVPPHSSSLSSQKRLEPQYKRDRPTRLHRSQNPRYSLHFDTVATLLDHVYPRRVLCNVSVVCSRPSARDSRSMSRAIRPSKHALPRTRYTLFCIFRWRRLPRSTALDVAGNSVSSRNVNAFSRFVENTLFNVSPIHLKRLIHCRSFRNLPRAVWVRQRRSNKAYM